MNELLNDPQLGLITIKRHPSAKRYIFRATELGIQITCPERATLKQIRTVFEDQRPHLPRLQEKLAQKPRLEKNAVLKMCAFSLSITESGYGNLFQSRFLKETLEIICPCDTDYSRPEVQEYIAKNLTKVLRYYADRYLPARLSELARKIGIDYNECSISYGRQRLGKCDSYRNITLSYRLMMLPAHLVDYVILHELTHCTEMNHGEGFHRLLNRYCDGAHRRLEKELKEFIFPI